MTRTPDYLNIRPAKLKYFSLRSHRCLMGENFGSFTCSRLMLHVAAVARSAIEIIHRYLEYKYSFSTSYQINLCFPCADKSELKPGHLTVNDSFWQASSVMALPADIRRIYIIHIVEQLLFGLVGGGVSAGSCSSQEHVSVTPGQTTQWAVSMTIQSYTW